MSLKKTCMRDKREIFQRNMAFHFMLISFFLSSLFEQMKWKKEMWKKKNRYSFFRFRFNDFFFLNINSQKRITIASSDTKQERIISPPSIYFITPSKKSFSFISQHLNHLIDFFFFSSNALPRVVLRVAMKWRILPRASCTRASSLPNHRCWSPEPRPSWTQRYMNLFITYHPIYPYP